MIREWKMLALVALLVVAVVSVESYLPYYAAGVNAPGQAKFLGQIEFPYDQNMYFSFVRQAFEGNLLFANRLTAAPNDAVFLNLEFLAVGQLMRVFDLSHNGAYQVWRFAGICLLTFGFSLLASVVLQGLRRKVLALCAFVFAGGFGAFFLFAEQAGMISRETMIRSSLDFYTGLLPFTQILLNPHFSLPHGVLLLGIALFLLGERQASPAKFYIASGVVFLVDGFIRPYDLIIVSLVLSTFIAGQAWWNFDRSRSLMRACALMVPLPALLYSIWLFKFHPVFKYWSLQGLDLGGLIPLHGNLMAYGVVAVLAGWRVAQYRRNPFSPIEMFLCLWFGVVFFVSHIGKVVPFLGFAMQCTTVLFAPLVLLACQLDTGDGKRLARGVAAVAVLLMVVGHLGVLAFHLRGFLPQAKFRDYYNANLVHYYASPDEVEALDWIDGNIARGSVVLALPRVSGRIGKYTGASTVLGHYSVTPDFEKLFGLTTRWYSTRVFSMKERDTLRETLRADYVYIGPEEKRLLGFDPDTVTGFTKVFSRGTVSLYRVS